MDYLNAAENQYLFGEYFENECSRKINAKQKSKSLSSGLKESSASMSQNHRIISINSYQSQPFQGSSLQRRPRGRGQQVYSRAFQRGVRINSPFVSEHHKKLLRLQKFPNGHPVIRKKIQIKQIPM